MTVDARVGESFAVGSAGAAVRLTSLTKRFGPKTAVDNVSLTVERGAAFGLIGPNGAGKTTTFSVVAGYLRPTQGSVEVLGLRPTAVDALRSRLGVLPQDAVLPPSEPVSEFLVHLARLQGISGQRAVATAYDALANVDGTGWWRQRCGSLSHGMAKRVGLAQAFLGQPEVVLLDEPTAGLDPRAAFEMRRYIKAKRGKTAIVISSHNLQELEELCDAAAILDRGRVVVAGTMADLTASNEQVRVAVGRGSRRGTEAGAVPMQALRDVADVRAIDFDDETLVLTVAFDRTRADAETIIGRVLSVLLGNQVRISGVAKGRGLEQRVRDLT
jgi:ABC-type multidrug transport system ATPase subunit